MLRVGLTGGYATGKSFVAGVLADLGCYLIRADELGHQVLLPGGEAYPEVVREFGPDILSPDGTINRKRLAAAVFGGPGRLDVLNALVHPPVIRREEELIARYRAEDPDGIVVVEAAILVETGSHHRFNRIIVTVCRPEQQVERAMARNGVTREQVEQRLQRQMPLEEKRKYADYVIDTSGAKEDTVRQTREVYQALRSVKV
jgi:dephospho-CoA kinase